MGIRIHQSNVPSSVADVAITKEMHDGLGRATTTTSSLEAEQGSGNISKTKTKTTSSGPCSPRTSLEGAPGCHVTMGVVLFRLGLKGYLTCLMNHHSEKVTTSENKLKSTKAVYNKALITLTKRVKKLEKKLKHKRRRKVIDSSKNEEASLNNENSPKQGRMIEEINEDENVNLVKSRSLKEGESLKRPAEEELAHEQQKKQKTKYPIIDWEIYTEGIRKYWKIIRVGNITKEHQFFVDIIKAFDKENLVKLRSLVKERFSSLNPTKDKEISLWVELKRLFESDEDDELWKFKSFELIWRLYDWGGVHYISIRDGHDIFMLVEKEYPLLKGALLMMLVQKLQVYEHNEMAEELLRKIFM
nr:hypothetical protein [Tanacetum cinerariifolium]